MGETSCTFWALECFLLGVTSLVALHMLQSDKGALTRRAHVKSGFANAARRGIGRRITDAEESKTKAVSSLFGRITV